MNHEAAFLQRRFSITETPEREPVFLFVKMPPFLSRSAPSDMV